MTDFAADGGSSTSFVIQVMADSIRAVDPAAAEAVLAESSLRTRYQDHMMTNVVLSAKSTKNALAIAAAGLDSFHRNMAFTHPDGTAVPLRDAMRRHAMRHDAAAAAALDLCTATLYPEKGTPPRPLAVPAYGELLEGDELRTQVADWVAGGRIEPSAAAAVNEVLSNPAKYTALQDRVFVVMGAGAAMGPFETLLGLGATVVAVDIAVPDVWRRLIAVAAGSPGTLIVPTQGAWDGASTEELANIAGCDLIASAPAVAMWLATVAPSKAMTVGAYAYATGALFVKLTAAMDAIQERLLETRPDTSLAFLCTPTDIHIRPKEAMLAAQASYDGRTLVHRALAALGVGYCVSNVTEPVETDTGETVHPIDCVVMQQGPNYLLSKRVQHWRAMLARSEGAVVSTNLAPASSTVSVMQNQLLAWAYNGTVAFRPIEIFAPDTSNAAMTIMLLHDLANERSSAHPATPLGNPLLLFRDGAWHGGFWRSGYSIRSVAELSAYYHLLEAKVAPVMGAAAAGAVTWSVASRMPSKL